MGRGLCKLLQTPHSSNANFCKLKCFAIHHKTPIFAPETKSRPMQMKRPSMNDGKQTSRSEGSGMVDMLTLLVKWLMSIEAVLFAEHLLQNIFQHPLLVRLEGCDFLLKASFVNSADLVGYNFTHTSVHLTYNPVWIIVNGRCDRDDDDSCKMLIQFLRAHNDARTNLLHLGTYSGIKIHPVDVKLIYYCQSSTLSSSNMSGASIWSSPCLCAFFAAAAHPRRTDGVVIGISSSSTLRIVLIAASAFFIATSLSKIGFSSRSNSARNCIAVLIVAFYDIHAAKVQNKTYIQTETQQILIIY